MRRIHLILYTVAGIAITMQGCTWGYRNEVNIYSHRHYPSDDKLFEEFTAKTGIKVNVVKATADQLIQRLEQEGENTPADLLITIDAGRLYRAKEKGLLQPIQSAVLDSNLNPALNDKDHYWYAFTYRARIIAYNKEKVNPADISTYNSLADPKWKGKILVQTSDNLYNQSLLASIIAHDGAEKAEEWAKAIVNNMSRRPQGNEVDQVKAMEAGVGDVAIVNSYYVARLLNSTEGTEKADAQKVGVVFPNQDSYGTHFNISGIGLAKYCHHKANAIKLLEFLSEKKAQSDFTNMNYEYPASPKVEPNATLKAWGDFKKDTLNLIQLGIHNADAVKIFDEAGWK